MTGFSKRMGDRQPDPVMGLQEVGAVFGGRLWDAIVLPGVAAGRGGDG